VATLAFCYVNAGPLPIVFRKRLFHALAAELPSLAAFPSLLAANFSSLATFLSLLAAEFPSYRQ